MSGDPKETVVEHDGLRLAVLDWGGDGNEPLVLLHPTGFCAGLFHPLALAADRPVPPDRHRPAGARRVGRPVRRARASRSTPYAQHVLGVLDQLGIDAVRRAR